MKLATVVLPIILSGCATKGMYAWGNYDKALYSAYKNPETVEELRLELEELIGDEESRRRRVAPGIYAELGTLYLQKGDAKKAITMYKKERDTWPESKGLMTAMIQNLERREGKTQGDEK